MPRISKQDYFMQIADVVRLRSPDLETKRVGAVLVDKNDRIVSTGHNGTPRGYIDQSLDWTNRESIYPRIIHAEMNAILYAGGRYEESTLYCTLSPCKDCIKLVAAAGIKTVIFRDRYKDYETVKTLAEEFGVKITQHGERPNG